MNKTNKKITILVIFGIIIAASITYLEIPRYGVTVNGAPKTDPICEGTIRHGFFSDYPIIEELILDHINNPESRLALEIPFYEMDLYRNFMIENFDTPNPNCFEYEYQGKNYDVMTIIGPKEYFTHSFFPKAFASDESDVLIHDFKNVYKTNEIMNFSLEFPSFCGEHIFAVEDVSSGSRIWERVKDIGCDREDEFIDRKQMMHITTESPRPGGANFHADPVITSYEGTFRFVYEVEEIRKDWTYQVFEKIPLHLDTDAHIRLAILAAFYIAVPLYAYGTELLKRFRK